MSECDRLLPPAKVIHERLTRNQTRIAGCSDPCCDWCSIRKRSIARPSGGPTTNPAWMGGRPLPDQSGNIPCPLCDRPSAREPGGTFRCRECGLVYKIYVPSGNPGITRRDASEDAPSCSNDVTERQKPPKDVNPATASVIPVSHRGWKPDDSADQVGPVRGQHYDYTS